MASAIIEVSAEAIEARFEALAAGDVAMKAPGEVVTVADREAERLLTRRLVGLLAAPVVGEEACSARPELLDALGSERAWLVDPLDGTANFVSGSPDWAVMAALVEHGEAVASWIWQPLSRRMFVAERGAGARLNGTPLAVVPSAPDRPGGAVLRRFLDAGTLERVDSPAVRDRLGPVGPGRYCAGVEYPLLIAGDQDFVLFWRTLPWDHVPGALLLEEAGGVAARPDGCAYRPADRAGRGLLAASNRAVWDQVQRTLFA